MVMTARGWIDVRMWATLALLADTAMNPHCLEYEEAKTDLLFSGVSVIELVLELLRIRCKELLNSFPTTLQEDLAALEAIPPATTRDTEGHLRGFALPQCEAIRFRAGKKKVLLSCLEYLDRYAALEPFKASSKCV